MTLNGTGGLIRVIAGKSKAARRLLPMIPAVFDALRNRHKDQGCPGEGWVFPTASRSGHIEESSAKQWHAKAFTNLEAERKEDPNLTEIKRFEPYCLRHTALTRLAEAGCDAFTLAKIAGHSSITITQRYCHPQADAIERAFLKIGNSKLVTKRGHQAQALALVGLPPKKKI